MKRFFFHIVTDEMRYSYDTGTLLASLEDVLLHGRTIANVLTKHRLMQINIGREPSPDDYLEVEDQDAKFLITLPLGRLLQDGAPAATMRAEAAA